MFLSFHHGDADEVAAFIDTFQSVITALSVGVSDGDRLAPVLAEAECLDKIADKYLGASTATIVLLGATTWARRFVDWEIAATLHPASPRALLAMPLRSALPDLRLPPRLAELGNELCLRPYPASSAELDQWLDDAAMSRSPIDPQPAPGLMRRDQHLSQPSHTEVEAGNTTAARERPTP